MVEQVESVKGDATIPGGAVLSGFQCGAGLFAECVHYFVGGSGDGVVFHDMYRPFCDDILTFGACRDIIITTGAAAGCTAPVVFGNPLLNFARVGGDGFFFCFPFGGFFVVPKL